ncbi:DUF421 domain-containing protein [Alteribacter natronophilus]|uniref:DUF421 domain-containing protein n=1 Tax=Alteribacter natronophilus TaxID=2583810 RepID=UPI00110F5C73|nr:DUF421 domain-containing protein [Alteribacter natronophilus]
MDLSFIWKAVLIVFGGVLILRIAGRKSISQLTVAQTVMMIAVGSLIIQPVGDRNIWTTLVITLILVLNLLLIEYLALKNDALEKFFYSKSIMVIENGRINTRNLKKMRLTVDMLELRLRQQGIQNFSDLQWATIESNGQLGYMLKPEKQTATKEDIQLLIRLLSENTNLHSADLRSLESNIFTEVAKKGHEKQPKDDLS